MFLKLSLQRETNSHVFSFHLTLGKVGRKRGCIKGKQDLPILISVARKCFSNTGSSNSSCWLWTPQIPVQNLLLSQLCSPPPLGPLLFFFFSFQAPIRHHPSHLNSIPTDDRFDFLGASLRFRDRQPKDGRGRMGPTLVRRLLLAEYAGEARRNAVATDLRTHLRHISKEWVRGGGRGGALKFLLTLR